MFVFSALVAGSFALGAGIANDISPTSLNIIRFAIAAGVLAGLAGWRELRGVFTQPGQWRFLILGGCLALYFILMFEGLKIANPVSMAAVFTLTPFLSGLFGAALLGQRLSTVSWAAILLGGIGALWVIFQGDLSRFLALEFGTGEAIFLVGVISHAIYTPLVRRLNRGAAPLPFSALTTVGALLVVALYGGADLFEMDFGSMPMRVWWVTLYLAVCASAITFFLLQFAALHLNSANVMAYTYLVPIWVIFWQLGLGEGLPSPQIWGGVVLTICAMLFLLYASTPRE